MKRNKKLFTLAFCIAIMQLSFAQHMDVQYTTGNTDQYPFNIIKAITFSGSNIQINKTNLYTDTKPLNDIRKITFGNLVTSLTHLTTENNEIFKIYPNPANKAFSVTISEETKQIKIFNSFGQLINAVSTKGQKSRNFEIQTTGIYIIQFVTYNQTITKKIVIVK